MNDRRIVGHDQLYHSRLAQSGLSNSLALNPSSIAHADVQHIRRATSADAMTHPANDSDATASMPRETRREQYRTPSTGAHIGPDDMASSMDSPETSQDKMARLEAENAQLRARIDATANDRPSHDNVYEQLNSLHSTVREMKEEIRRLWDAREADAYATRAQQPADHSNDRAHGISLREFDGRFRDDNDLLLGEGRAYMEQFEELFDDQPDSAKLHRLRTALIGDAQIWLCSFPSATRRDYTWLKMALIDHFKPRLTPEVAQTRYSALRQGPNMTVTDLRARMMELIRLGDPEEEFPDRRLINDMMARLRTGLSKKMLSHKRDPDLTFDEFVQQARIYEEEYERMCKWPRPSKQWQQHEPNAYDRCEGSEQQKHAPNIYNRCEGERTTKTCSGCPQRPRRLHAQYNRQPQQRMRDAHEAQQRCYPPQRQERDAYEAQ